MKNKVLKDGMVFCIIFMVILATILVKDLGNYDELWNYNFAKNIVEDRLPYKDFNMIQMPLLPIICAFFLKIFANELIVMRLLAVALNSTILFSIYKILDLLKVNKYFSYICLTLLYFIYNEYFLCMDYNFAVLLICILVIYFELKFVNKNSNILISKFKYDFILGILVGTTILIKQTTGLFLSLIFIFYKLLIVSKNEWNLIFKIIFYRLIGVLIPIAGFLIYISTNNIWIEFLDYTVFGIGTFDNIIPYTSLIKNGQIHIKVLSILLPITIVYLYINTIIKKLKTKEEKNMFVFFAYSIAHLIVIFPISDKAHFLIGAMPAIIAMIYIIYLEIIKIVMKNDNIKNFSKSYIKAFAILLVTYSLITNFIIFISKYDNLKNNTSRLAHYKLIPSNIDENIKNLDDYIIEQNNKGKKVYILDASACLYMIPIDKYNKDYDMFLIGNLGSKGEKGQIEKLQNEENAIVLIMNENYSRNWQNPEQVRKYIIENWKKIGEISTFDIYQK